MPAPLATWISRGGSEARLGRLGGPTCAGAAVTERWIPQQSLVAPCRAFLYIEYSVMANKTPITVAHGDGIGPEIMNATLQILDASGAALEIETIEIGEKVYL